VMSGESMDGVPSVAFDAQHLLSSCSCKGNRSSLRSTAQSRERLMVPRVD
jgi:hypothetical protein